MNNLEYKSGLITFYDSTGKQIVIKFTEFDEQQETLTINITWANGQTQTEYIQYSA